MWWIIYYVFLLILSAFLDYLPLNNAALLFSVGSTQGAVACVNIGILNDDEHEDDETFRVLITGLSGVATVDPCRMLTTILIRQNDMPISFTVQLLDPVVFESQGTVTVVVSANSNPTQRTLVTVTTNPVTALGRFQHAIQFQSVLYVSAIIF